MEKFEAEWTLADNVFELGRISAEAAGGQVGGKARVDLARKGLAYRSNFALDGIQADPLVSAFYPDYRGAVQGGLDLLLDVQGRGTQADAIKRNLSGAGRSRSSKERWSVPRWSKGWPPSSGARN